MTTKTFRILLIGLWAAMITAWIALEGVAYIVAMAGIALVWLGLVLERRRNYRRYLRR